MPNGDKTALDPAEVKNSGTAIGQLGADVNGFSSLNDIHPKPGDFLVGDWLNELVTTRRDTLYQHCNELSAALEEVGRKLQEIATEIESTDQSNGEKVSKLNSDLESTVHDMETRVGTVAPSLGGDSSGSDAS
ncbi:hypothetical protein [Saccharopolyspora sp. 5N708]|uniref:hypothetical protein n=1 Tax=Saccharopolyspora sp. 5N708 TaxID=3457424 RepID=UPI003FD61A0B